MKSLSAERRKDSKDFQKVLRDIDRFNEQKKKKRISLNKEKFMAEKAELTAEKQEEKELEELNDPNRPVVKRDLLLQRSAGDHDRLRADAQAPPQAAAVGTLRSADQALSEGGQPHCSRIRKIADSPRRFCQLVLAKSRC